MASPLLNYGRILWVGLITVWVGLSIGYDGFHRYGGAILATLAFYFLAAFLFYFRRQKLMTSAFYQIHCIAAIFHLGSSVAIGWATAANDSSWQSVLTRERSLWLPLDDANGTITDCSRGCYIERSNVVITERFPLVDLAIIFACISAFYHFVCAENQDTEVMSAVQQRSGQLTTTYREETIETLALTSRINKTRWLDYSLSASTMVVVVSSLCGVTDVFTLSLQALLQFILLDVAAAVEVELAKQPRSIDTRAVVGFIYLLYFLPLIAAMCAIGVNASAPSAPIIVLVVTSLHFVVGAVVAIRSTDGLVATAVSRYQNHTTLFFDAIILTSLGMAITGISAGSEADVYQSIVVASIFFALVGNSYCLWDNFSNMSPEGVHYSPFLTGSATSTFLLLSIVFAFMWGPTISVFASAWEKDDDQKPPDAIITVVLVIILLFSAFAIWFFVTNVLRVGNAITCEVGYIGLSFVTKTALHWLLWNGITGRDNSIYTEVGPNSTLVGQDMADDPGSLAAATIVPLIIGSALTVYGKYLLEGDTTIISIESKQKLMSAALRVF